MARKPPDLKGSYYFQSRSSVLLGHACHENDSVFFLRYLKRPELNATRFVETPEGLVSALGKTIFRAGDWGYQLTDGTLEICGRLLLLLLLL